MVHLHLLPLLLPTILASTASALALPDLHQLLQKRGPSAVLPPSNLPGPSTLTPAVSLKYIALGVGTQNYTCASTPNSPTSAPIQVGAIATLFDSTAIFQKVPFLIDTLPALALGLYSMTRSDISKVTGQGVLGTHYFNAAGQPVFDLTKVKARFTGKKLAGTPAPGDACPGPQNAGAVDWLLLGDASGGDAGASYGGVKYVYRVETAGGKPPASCAGRTGTFEVEYAAEYWYYG